MPCGNLNSRSGWGLPLSRGLLLATEHKEFDLLSIMSEAVREMSEGELMQMQKSRKLNITKEEYFNIIRKKTANPYISMHRFRSQFCWCRP